MKDLEHSPDESGRMTRRRFVWLMGTGAVFLGVMPATYLLAKRSGETVSPQTTRVLLDKEFKGLTAYQATVLHDVAALIIPTDDLPGATEAGVIDQLDQYAVAVDRYRRLYQLGVEWLDHKARSMFETSSFLDLEAEAQEKILHHADRDEMTYLEKNVEWLMHGESHIGKRFFTMVKTHTFHVFYSSPIGWQVVGYQRPPQWSGHPDYFRCG